MPVSRNRPFKPTDETVLHPTKGNRKVSVRRSRASVVVAAIRNGATADLRAIRQFLNTGL